MPKQKSGQKPPTWTVTLDSKTEQLLTQARELTGKSDEKLIRECLRVELPVIIRRASQPVQNYAGKYPVWPHFGKMKKVRAQAKKRGLQCIREFEAHRAPYYWEICRNDAGELFLITVGGVRRLTLLESVKLHREHVEDDAGGSLDDQAWWFGQVENALGGGHR